jgi:hypothetical protein
MMRSFLVAGGELSGGVKVFQVEANGAELTEVRVASNRDVLMRTSFAWLRDRMKGHSEQ